MTVARAVQNNTEEVDSLGASTSEIDTAVEALRRKDALESASTQCKGVERSNASNGLGASGERQKLRRTIMRGCLYSCYSVLLFLCSFA